MKLERVLITGGLGLIGSHLGQSLMQISSQIIVLDDQSTGKTKNLESIPERDRVRIVIGSITDTKLVNQLMEGVDTCFHLAASLGVNRILQEPINSYQTNIHGTENVVNAAVKNETKLFMASTSEIYGKNPTQPLTENSDRVLGSPLNIRWAYSEAKAIDESLLQMYRQERGLDFLIGRFFNTVGPRQTGSYGMVLPRFVRSALNGEDLQVYGDGKQTRVFCHVKDAVDALLSLSGREDSYGEVFNIGGEGEVSIAELAAKVIAISNSSSKIVFVPYSQAYSQGFEETYRRVPDTTKIRTLTGWKPKYSLEQIIEDVISYFKL